MNVPCPSRITCPGTDFPVSNYSSEAPDIFLFGSTGYPVWNPLDPLGPGGTGDPPAWFAQGCLSLCYSPVSQEAADLCAAVQAFLCYHGGGGDDGHGPLQPVFFNDPQQCEITCPDGNVFTWTIGFGVYVSLSQDLANQLAHDLACIQASRHFFCLGDIPATACINVLYSQKITITGPNPGPFDVEVIMGALPAGFTLSQSERVNGVTNIFVDGTPTTTGNSTFTLKVSDPNGNFMQKQFTISTVGISNLASLPQPQVNLPYSQQLTANGGTGPYTFSLVPSILPHSGLPSGLTLSDSGLISGTAAFGSGGAYNVSMLVTDSKGVSCLGVWSVTVKEPPGPNWSKLVWSQYVPVQSLPNNTASGSAVGPNATCSINKDAGAFFPAISPVAANLSGGYTGPNCNCRVTLNVTANTGFGSVAMRIFQDGIQVATYGFNPGVGSHDFNFSLIAGVNSVITIDDASPGNDWGIRNSVGTPGTLAFSWIVYNV